MTRLGFVGLGRMGGSMATHLVRAGHDVAVFDRRDAPIDAMESMGATGVESVAAVGERSDVVFLSLPGPEAVESVAAELAGSLGPGSVVVDTTTSTPETTRTVADSLSEVGVSTLGAPVSGGTYGAEAGTLTVMVGGDPSELDRCRPYVDAFAKNVFHVGEDPGHGHAVKLLNNYLSFAAMVATSEAVVLGEAVGLDIETMCEVFTVSTGRNSATEDKFPDYIAEGEEVGFSLALMEKDIALLERFGDEKGLPLLLAGVVASQIEYTRARYGETGDMTDVYGYLRAAMTGADRPNSGADPRVD
ncbi:NAD(P)-dependent oxidoreductase [Natronorarus salvus]|uniref:NAD(P)-dependent oxidoreductase n=1 Tax=Natronorarus salvus TaxID=3117733 RepID=UPI002F260F30